MITTEEKQLRDYYQNLDSKAKAEFIGKLSPTDWLRFKWILIARDKQLPPPGNWRHWLMLCGRGFGKSITGAQFIKRRVESGSKYLVITAPTSGDIEKYCIKGKSGLLAQYKGYPKEQIPRFIGGNNPRVEFQNGAVALCISGERPDSFRGNNATTYWCDELASFRYTDSFTQLKMSFRGDDCRGIITTTPRPTELIKKLAADPSIITVKGTTYENVEYLGKGYIDDLEKSLTQTQIRQELFAEIIEDAAGALFQRPNIDQNRVQSYPLEDLKRVVVGVDPSVAAHKQGDETGIIVAGFGKDNRFYVLADYSGRYSPNEWAKVVQKAFNSHKADRIIAESNQGGALVESNIRTVSSDLPIKLIHASRGKYSRAEPISALYEQNRVSHVGVFPQLEDQQCTWISGETEKSPDRMDALVYALSELSGNKILGNVNSFRMVRSQSERADLGNRY